MFSIHCKVLRIGRPKKEESITGSKQKREENNRLGDSPQNSPAVTRKQSLHFQYKLKEKSNQRCAVARSQRRLVMLSAH